MSDKRPDDMKRIETEAQAAAFIEKEVAAVKAQVGDGKVLLALSGGVDSSVTALLLHKAIGDKLTCVFVDNAVAARIVRCAIVPLSSAM